MSKRKKLVTINGEIFVEKDAKISVFDRGFLFGDSIYEVTCTYDGKLLFWDEHLKRLWESAEKMGIHLDYTHEYLNQECEKIIKELGVARSYLRLIVTRGSGEIGLDTRNAKSCNLVIIAQELAENPKAWYEDGVSAIVAETLRNPKKSTDPSIKSGNYLNNVIALSEATKKDAFEAIMLNHEGYVTEGTTSNIWIVKNGQYITPPLKAGLLGGITRYVLTQLLKNQSMPFQEANFTSVDLDTADEIFLTSSTKFIVPITTLNGQAVGNQKPGPKTLELLEKYHNYIKTTHA